MVRFARHTVLPAIFLVMAAALPAAAQTAQQCEPVVGGGEKCWGQNSSDARFTKEFDVRVDRVWTDGPQDSMYFLRSGVTRLDTGQQLELGCAWAEGSGDENYKRRSGCYDLNIGGTYHVRAAYDGAAVVFVRQPIDGTMTWVETTCGLGNGSLDDC